MPAPRHARLSALGTLPGGEIFSFGVSLGMLSTMGSSMWEDDAFLPNSTVYDDLRDDLAAFWGAVPLSNRAILKTMKFAFIGPDGHYERAPVERVIGGASGLTGSETATNIPNQAALAVTLHSASDLGRVKGRFYLPMFHSSGLNTDGTIAETVRDTVESAAATFITNINNQPGLDVLNIRAVVASAGRRNADGSVKLPPALHDVNQVSVGRVVDTQRRRRNKLRELRGTPTPVS